MTPRQATAQRAACGDENTPPFAFSIEEIEQWILRAYIRLEFQPSGADGSRSIVVMRSRELEVRLSELPPGSIASGIPPFWLEAFSVAGHESIDSCGCFEFDESEMALAVNLVLDALKALPLRPRVQPELPVHPM
ncbi:hypothetical protein [Microvirga zambiensis]|uniref:hypothetical protein n=1 Tax=Microvirga zambiensis TaxID=1402137 RepID=UPI00191D3314|nr:hypothetical protein [Microvirga zambiensis]